MSQVLTLRLAVWNQKLWLLVLAVMPFHAFLTTWLGANLGARPLWQAWKEIVLVVMATLVGVMLKRDPKLRKFIFSYRANQLIVALVVLHLLLLAILRPEIKPALLALKTNLEFLGLFVLAQSVAFYADRRRLESKLRLVIVGAAALVALFGMLQVLILPNNFLEHFGYGTQTLRSFLPLPDSPQVRILSTLGGPNQLGAYLILPILLVLTLFWRRPKLWLALLLVPMLITLFGTYSRSAWIGAAAAIILTLILLVRRKQFLVGLAAGAVALAIVVFVLAVKAERSDILAPLLLHSSPRIRTEQTTDVFRLQSIKQGLTHIIKQPWGYGPGSAGPASLVGDQPLVTENYYLQIGTELGLPGLMLFVWLLAVIAVSLWRIRNRTSLAIPLLASFIGISFINLVLHGWADSTTALIWWGSAGAIIRVANPKLRITNNLRSH
ncbi:O-antigen ligase family protein [Candidatus Microgenomates bacterium]|nr:O-antigen ligase family protein [Candidatus Microgenomates bacterium]